MGRRLLKVTAFGPCEICHSLDTKLYEGKDGARVVACCQGHANQVLNAEEEIAMKQINRFVNNYKRLRSLP